MPEAARSRSLLHLCGSSPATAHSLTRAEPLQQLLLQLRLLLLLVTTAAPVRR